jgi:hypothetical protein
MSISIDTVYQRVLSILNKEQRGYVTPQEFNLFANQAQLDLFEQYFYDIGQFLRLPANGHANASIPNLIEEKISLFEKELNVSINNGYYLLPSDLYRLNNVVVQTSENEAEQVSYQHFLKLNKSDLTAPSETYPVYIQNDNKINLFPNTIVQDVTLYYVKKPAEVEWKYQIVFGEPLYDSSSSIDFELHESEETELVIKILELCGILIKDLSLYQAFDKEDQETIQQQKL